jgi:hypothetical protein
VQAEEVAINIVARQIEEEQTSSSPAPSKERRIPRQPKKDGASYGGFGEYWYS